MATKRVMKRVAAPPKPVGAVTKRPSQVSHPEPDIDPDEYQDDRPVRPSAARSDDGSLLRGGWGASHETIDSTSNYAQAFRPETKSQVVKILDAKPYVAFRRHWIDRVGMGKRAYVCLQSIGQDCPLCNIGDKPGAVSAFNIAVLADDGVPALKSWDCGVKISRQLETFHTDPKIGPLDRSGLYFLVSKTEAQQRQQVTTMINPVRGKDLLEDYGIPPLEADQIEMLLAKAYTPEIITINPRYELEEIAAEMTGDDSPSKPYGE